MESRRDESSRSEVGSRPLSRRSPEATNVMGRSDGWVRPGDEALLESLRRDGPESCPLLAARIGMHLKYARRRCEELESRGFVRSRDERFYELTERGARYLDGEALDESSDGSENGAEDRRSSSASSAGR